LTLVEQAVEAMRAKCEEIALRFATHPDPAWARAAGLVANEIRSVKAAPDTMGESGLIDLEDAVHMLREIMIAPGQLVSESYRNSAMMVVENIDRAGKPEAPWSARLRLEGEGPLAKASAAPPPPSPASPFAERFSWPIREAYFAYKHLPSELREVSARFYGIAEWLVEELPNNAERTVALRKLLEAKDAA